MILIRVVSTGLIKGIYSVIEIITFPNILYYCIVFSLLVFLSISIFNYYYTRKFKKSETSIELPSIDILIPARNEEQNIEPLLISLTSLNYPDYNIIIGDDNSEDNTFNLINQFKSQNNFKIKPIQTGKKPDGWTGKNFACHRLSKESNSDYILFIDADCRLTPDSLKTAITILLNENLSLLSIFPTQIYKSFSEKLIVPIMNWILLTLLNLKKVFTSRSTSFTAANGQFMLFKRESYIKIGGHEKVKDNFIEDMALAKNIKRNAFTMRTYTGNRIITCNMYGNFFQALNGFSKNFYPGFGLPFPLFILLLSALEICFLLPIVLCFIDIKYIPVVLIIILNRIFISLTAKESIFMNIVLHPFQMIILFFGGIFSIIKSKTGKLTWKGRPL